MDLATKNAGLERAHAEMEGFFPTTRGGMRDTTLVSSLAAAVMHSIDLPTGRNVTLRVRPNGIGIDSVVADKGRDGHFGLHEMRERAARIGGKLTLVSSQGSGTKMILVVPGRHIFRKPGTSPLENIPEVLKGHHPLAATDARQRERVSAVLSPPSFSEFGEFSSRATSSRSVRL